MVGEVFIAAMNYSLMTGAAPETRDRVHQNIPKAIVVVTGRLVPDVVLPAGIFPPVADDRPGLTTGRRLVVVMVMLPL